MNDTVKVTINGEAYEVDKRMTVLQACELAGVEIPRFCYHERLSVAGNCRMCLVEVKPGPPKPQASCALPVADGQEIQTHSAMAKSARHGVMEFLLINHPLDCPICDQGGECDLQDQAMAYGSGMSRYHENKRAVAEKHMGPLIKTVMTRCIHCTRCVRFAAEVAGVEDIGLLNRGEHAEISTLEKAVTSELSGNLIDLCPVGALTSAPYAFHARPWELQKTDSIDVSSAEGANIRIDARGNEIMRILPRLNEQVNEEWISDKARFACDGLKYQRLDRVYMRGGDNFKKTAKLQEASWDSAFAIIADTIKAQGGDKIAALAGDLQNLESMYAMRLLLDKLGAKHRDARQDSMILGGENSHRASYLFNSGIAGLDECDALLLIGCHARHEAPLINARIRKNWIERDLKIGFIGTVTGANGTKGHGAPNYEFADLGGDHTALTDLASGKGEASDFAKILQAAEKPMVIIGTEVLQRSDSADLLLAVADICKKYNVIGKDWNGYNILHRAAARVGALDIGFVPQAGGKNTAEIIGAAESGKISLLYLLGADELDFKPHKDCLVVYQGHHGDKGAGLADIILPSAAYAECDGIYINLEGRVQMAQRAAHPRGDAREDWAIVRALSGYCDAVLPFDDLSALRHRLYEDYPHVRQVGGKPDTAQDFSAADITSGVAASKKTATKAASAITVAYDFYAADVIARASKTMRLCAEEFGGAHVE